MNDMIVSGAYLASAAAILLAVYANAKVHELSMGHPKDYERHAHIFSCVSLSAAYAAHALI